MKHKCFISFKTEDREYKKYIQDKLDVDMIDKSLNEPINSDNVDYIMRKIREDYLCDSTVTIHLIGSCSSEYCGEDQTYIKKELQASLYNGQGNTRNGILGVVLPEMVDEIYQGSYYCSSCKNNHNSVYVNLHTIKEFSENYYIPKNYGCAWSEEDRYCVLVKWNDFIKKPNSYIDKAFEKRTDPIAEKITVYPK